MSEKYPLDESTNAKTIIFMRHGKIEFSFLGKRVYSFFYLAIKNLIKFLNKYKFLQVEKYFKAIIKILENLNNELEKVLNTDSDYKNLKYCEFMKLLLNQTDPPLARQYNGIDLGSIPKKIDVIYHSTARRSIQTANFIQDQLAIMGYKRPRIADGLQKELAEIRFSKQIISRKEYKKFNGLTGCRPMILRKWFEGNNLETFQDSIDRVEKLCNFLKSSPHSNILIISHGLYLRLVFMYFTKQNKSFGNLRSNGDFLGYGQFFRISLTDAFFPHPSFTNHVKT